MSNNNQQVLSPASRRSYLTDLRRQVGEFHESERGGLSIIEIILIIFVAVVILIALAAFFNDTVYQKVKETINTLLGTNIS